MHTVAEQCGELGWARLAASLYVRLFSVVHASGARNVFTASDAVKWLLKS